MHCIRASAVKLQKPKGDADSDRRMRHIWVWAQQRPGFAAAKAYQGAALHFSLLLISPYATRFFRCIGMMPA